MARLGEAGSQTMKDCCHFCSQPLRIATRYVPKRDEDGLIRDKLTCDRCFAVYDIIIKTRPELMSRGRVVENDIDRMTD